MLAMNFRETGDIVVQRIDDAHCFVLVVETLCIPACDPQMLPVPLRL